MTTTTKKIDLKDFDLPQLTQFMEHLGHKAFRARQIFTWLYRPGIASFSQMTDISRQLREELEEKCLISRLTPAVKKQSEDGSVKYGFRLADDRMIESVLIPDEGRNTLCLSSQVGCAMGCVFCRTGTMGFKRNLSPAEIVNQVCAVLEDLGTAEDGEEAGLERLNNLVFMGMGEPLANFDNLITSINILLEQRGLNFSERRITVSTCGLVPMIEKLGEKAKVNLAISLHAVDDSIRSQLMKVNDTWPVEQLLAACRRYPLPPRRRIMIEYILIEDVNDSTAAAQLLARKLHGIKCKINLLPYNESPTLPYRRPSQERIEKFQQILQQAGYTVLLRTSRGQDIDAACGQLACE